MGNLSHSFKVNVIFLLVPACRNYSEVFKRGIQSWSQFPIGENPLGGAAHKGWNLDLTPCVEDLSHNSTAKPFLAAFNTTYHLCCNNWNEFQNQLLKSAFSASKLFH
ncbi:hypothetical protein SUGI_0460470 [Cryptomeria japonica]|nr:hypothetical protein SUGI_0460470 [Cryptomeria japonica]